MPQNPSEDDSSVISNSLFDLDLPVVREGEEPLPAPAPSFELMLEHARFLIESGMAPVREPSSKPFVLD